MKARASEIQIHNNISEIEKKINELLKNLGEKNYKKQDFSNYYQMNIFYNIMK